MLHIQAAGPADAPAIIFLHAIATSGWMWQGQLDHLRDYRCLVLDLPGHGQSRATPWTSLSATASQIAQIIRSQVPQGKAHIVGLSMGSYVGLQLMSDAPEVVDHAVLSGLNVLPLPHLRLMNAFGLLMVPFIKTQKFIRMNAGGLRIPDDQYAGYQRSVRQVSRRAYLRASGDAGRFRLPDNAASIPCPTLLVAGEHEHTLIRQSLEVSAATLPHAQAWIAPGVGHGWSGEAPELFARTVRAWVSDAPLPAELLPVEQARAAESSAARNA